MSAVPAVNTLVEITILGGGSYPSRVEDATGDRLTLAAPLNLLVGEVPSPGAQLTLRWAAGNRGRYAQDARLVETTHAGGIGVWLVDLVGSAQIQQERRFVRGGGGERVQMWPAEDGVPTGDPVAGAAVDFAEGSIRARFGTTAPVGLIIGDEVGVGLVLDGDELTLHGRVHRTMIDPVDRHAEIVVIYAPEEAAARVIRRYVFRLQAQQRSRVG